MLSDKTTLKKCLDCCLGLGESHDEIIEEIRESKICHHLDYRISVTYGIVRIAKTSISSINDIFGATVNRCAKINRSAPANGVIIGEGLYGLVKEFEKYSFKKIESDIVSPEYGYTGYIVSKRHYELINF